MRSTCTRPSRALGLPLESGGLDAATLARTMAPLAVLLVLDHCEHVPAAAAALAEALQAHAPRTALQAPSREPLNLRGEVVLRLAGLALPPVEAGAGDIDASPAVALLAECVRAHDRHSAIDECNATAAARLVVALDGIPLALEWVAARVPLLGVQGVLDRLDEQLRPLSRGARRADAPADTARGAAVEPRPAGRAAARRLPPPSAAFRRLGVFADSFTLDAAGSVCTGEGDDPWSTLEAVQALVDKSLVDVVRGRGRQAARAWRSRAVSARRRAALGTGWVMVGPGVPDGGWIGGRVDRSAAMSDRGVRRTSVGRPSEIRRRSDGDLSGIRLAPVSVCVPGSRVWRSCRPAPCAPRPHASPHALRCRHSAVEICVPRRPRDAAAARCSNRGRCFGGDPRRPLSRK